METDLEKKLLRPSDVAELCGVTRNTVYRWIRQEIFVPVRIGGCTYIRGSDFRAHLNGQSELDERPELRRTDDLDQDAERMLLSFRGRRRS